MPKVASTCARSASGSARPIVREGDVWAFGEPRRPVTLEAPDFTRPDDEGREHSLSDARGKKVMLVTWASW